MMNWVCVIPYLAAYLIVGSAIIIMGYLCGHRMMPVLDGWLDFLRSKKEREFRQFHRRWYYKLLRLPTTAWKKIPGQEGAWPTFEAWQDGVLVASLTVERFKDVERHEDLIVCSIPVETIVRRLVTLSFDDGHWISGCCRYCPKANHRCKLVDWLYKDILRRRFSVPFRQQGTAES